MPIWKTQGKWKIRPIFYFPSNFVQNSHHKERTATKQVIRFFRLPLQKENEALNEFSRLALILYELDIQSLYSAGIVQLVLNSARKEQGWSSAHIAVDISIKAVLSGKKAKISSSEN